MQSELSKKYAVKVIPHNPAQTERGLQWFKISFQLPDNSTQIPTANETKPYIIPLQLMNSLNGRQ